MPSTGGVQSGSEYDIARTRKVTAEAEITELELAKINGELVSAEDVVNAWSDTLAVLKSRLITIPSKAAPLVATEESAGACQKIIDDLIREALDELANYNPKVQPAKTAAVKESLEVSDVNIDSASSPKRKRVGRPRKTARLAE